MLSAGCAGRLDARPLRQCPGLDRRAEAKRVGPFPPNQAAAGRRRSSRLPSDQTLPIRGPVGRRSRRLCFGPRVRANAGKTSGVGARTWLSNNASANMVNAALKNPYAVVVMALAILVIGVT